MTLFKTHEASMKKSSSIKQTNLIAKYNKQANHHFQYASPDNQHINKKTQSNKKPPLLDIISILAIAAIIACGIAFILTTEAQILS